MNWIIPWEALDPDNIRSRHHRAKKLGYVNQKSAAVNRSNVADSAAITPVAEEADIVATSPAPINPSPGGGGGKSVVFGLDTTTATSPEHQFLLSPDDNLDPDLEKHGESIPSSPLPHSQSSGVTFASSPTQLELKQKSIKKSSHRSLFKMNTGDNYPPAASQAMDDHWVVATGRSSCGGSMSNWWRRQQRWSRKSEAPSQEDSNSGGSGSGVGGSSSGWMNWLEGAGGTVCQKKSLHVSQQSQDMSEKRRSRKSSSKRLSSQSKPRRKKSSFVWEGGFMNKSTVSSILHHKFRKFQLSLFFSSK